MNEAATTCTCTCTFKYIVSQYYHIHAVWSVWKVPQLSEKTRDAGINHFETHTFMRSVQVASFWQGLLRHSSMLISQCVPWKPVSEQLHAYLHAASSYNTALFSRLQDLQVHVHVGVHVDQWTLYNMATHLCTSLWCVSLAITHT